MATVETTTQKEEFDGETQSRSFDGTQQVYPGSDISVAAYDSLSLVTFVKQCMDQSKEARKPRDWYSQRNYDADNAWQDWSKKNAAQSRYFVPKTPMAVDQIGAFVTRGLTGFGGTYFGVDLSPDPEIVNGPLSESDVIGLMKHRLESQSELPPGATPFTTTIGDGVKSAALSGLLILKIHGCYMPTRKYEVEKRPITSVYQDRVGNVLQHTASKDQLVVSEGEVWRLLVEPVRVFDYFPDPTGKKLFEIHRTYKDLHEVISLADSGYYDKDAVEELIESGGVIIDSEVQHDLERQTNQDATTFPSFRKQVEIWEYWGTVLTSQGTIATREDGSPLTNQRIIIGNKKYVLRKPEDNPYWDQTSPFIVGALVRKPFSVFHKALFDHAVELNLALNEVFNLLIDGALRSVWGAYQIKDSMVKNPEQFTNGIPQGAVFLVEDALAPNEDVVKNIKLGTVPPEALQAYNLLDTLFNAASMLNDTKTTALPKKYQSATAEANASQASSMFFDAVINELEQSVMVPALHKVWSVMLQHVDDWLASDVVGIIGEDTAKYLASMSKEERFVRYHEGLTFKVNGLSTLTARTREFQKFVMLLQTVAQSPVLLQVFIKKYSPEKILQYLLKSLGIDPGDLKLSQDEKAMLQQNIQELPFYANLAQGMGGMMGGEGQPQAEPNQQPGNEVSQVQSDINQLMQPSQTL